jgi:putative SOS response-associated peptidase YedK
MVLAPKDHERWLEPENRRICQLICSYRLYPAEEMKAWMVSSAVGNVRNNSPELYQPLEGP